MNDGGSLSIDVGRGLRSPVWHTLRWGCMMAKGQTLWHNCTGFASKACTAALLHIMQQTCFAEQSK